MIQAVPEEALERVKLERRNRYGVIEEPIGTARKVRIVLIGAGASGINMLRALRVHLASGSWTATAYEKNLRVGGTWFENRYPGCRCDIPAHNYQFAWNPNPSWSSFFASSHEIEEYLERTWLSEKRQNDAAELRTECRVINAKWNEENSIWNIVIEDLKTGEMFEDHANFLLNASGILNDWHWPDIPGRLDFQGDMVHSANWPSEISVSGKTVAVIGNGSSGVQIVPALLPEVKSLVHFIRSPTWITPPPFQAQATKGVNDIFENIKLDENNDFTPEQIQRFNSDPSFYRKFVKAVERDINGRFPIIVKDSDAQTHVFKALSAYMAKELHHDSRLCNAIIPKFPVGCRRLTSGVGYLNALTSPKTRVVTEGISRIVKDGIELLSGEIIAVDAIVCATGFDVSFSPRFPIIGRGGNLQDLWREKLPQAYMSCAVAGLPNYFVFLGPNSPIGHGSVFTITEHIAKYIVRILKKCQTENIASIAPSFDSVADFADHIRSFMPRTAWQGSCRSWFKGALENGPVTALHPGSRLHFFHMLESFRGEDWVYTYERRARSNRFAYLGNGFSTKELDASYDPTWYLDEPDKL